MTNKKLGRGLDALLSPPPPSSAPFSQSGVEAAPSDTQILMIDVKDMFPSQYQPREDFDDDSLDELASSIKEHGILHPICARRQPEGYQIISGERRWRAAQRAGLSEVPVIVKDVADEGMLEIALIENIQREDLNPIELALAYKEMIERLNITQEELADKIGKNRSTVTNILRLLDLPDEIREYVSRGTLSMGHARALLSLSPNEMLPVANKVIEHGLSVREVESLIHKIKEKGNEPSSLNARKSANIIDIEDRLRKMLGTKVSIFEKGGAGRIVINYYSIEEFEKLSSRLFSQPNH